MWLVDLQNLSELLSDALSNPPLLLVHLKLLKNSNQGFSLGFAHNSHDVRDMLDDSQLDLVTLVLEEDIDHFEEVLFCVSFSNQFGHFVQTLTQGDFDLLILDFQQFLINTEQVALPFVPPDCIQHSWEVIGAAIRDFVILGQRSDIAICHFAKLLQQFGCHLSSFQLIDKLPQVLVGSDPDDLVTIFEEVQHDFGEVRLALLLAA